MALPVTVVTGFLGSGKTTLIGRLLRHPGMERAAVIVNELGEVGLDHELMEASSERTTLLSNGCLCCAVRTDLQETLRELFVRRRAGEVIDFDRVYVETSGLADPAPVLHSLHNDGLLAAQYRLNGVVTLVDAVNGAAQLDTMPEAAKQAAVADRILITKKDLSSTEDLDALTQKLQDMNSFAPITHVLNGEIDPAALDDIEHQWLGRAGAGEAGHAHTHGVSSFCLWFERPFTWERLRAALELLTALRGPDLLRVKGIVHVEGEPGPIAIHGAQHLFHPPLALAPSAGGERRSRIVFIVRNLARERIEAVFNAIEALGP